jgi:hypothetical protein
VGFMALRHANLSGSSTTRLRCGFETDSRQHGQWLADEPCRAQEQAARIASCHPLDTSSPL